MQIAIKHISKTYRNSLGQVDREVLKDLNLEIEKGTKLAIMGPSGSGKTTLLNLLGTLDAPDTGSITIDNQMVAGMTERDILAFRNTKIGFVFQFHHLLPQCTLWENTLLPTLPQKGNKDDAYLHAEKLLKYMGIWEHRNNLPGELSGGECQRTAVARALINHPEILLADEPTGSLDSENAELLMDMLIQINKQMNITLIIATHSLDMARKMDHIYRIERGNLTEV